MGFTKQSLFGMALLLVSSVAASDVPETQQAEVAHLLRFVKSTTCSIERNGQRHDGKAAYSHILTKYDHFRDRIRSTEDFIAFSATKSTLTGKYYVVFCGTDAPQRTEDWLRQELSNFRKTGDRTDL